MLENHSGNDCPNDDDERDKDGQREPKPPPRGTIDGNEPLAVALFHVRRNIALPLGFLVQMVQFLGGPAGEDGFFQGGDRRFVPRRLLGQFVLFAQPVQRDRDLLD